MNKLGKDVEISPKKELRQPASLKAVRLDPALDQDPSRCWTQPKGHETTERLEASGSLNAVVSHRVRLSDKKPVDAELKRWIKKAYESA